MNYVPGDLRDQLAHLGYDVVQAGLVVGSGGNLSAREPGGDTCWVTAAGTWLDRLSRSSFVSIQVDDGSPAPVVEPYGARFLPPTTELALHLAVYRARPDVTAVVHLHPQTVLLLDALGERVRLLTTDHLYYLRRVASVPFRSPGSVELAGLAAAAVADGTDCVVLSRHGICVVADSVELAHKRVRNLEEAARLTYAALAAGRLDALTELPDDFLDGLTAV